MKKILRFAPILLLTWYGCNDADKTASSDSDIDAARNFIQAALNGEFDKAGQFMVNDSINREDLNALRRLGERLDAAEKQKYRESTLRIHERRPVNDSTSIIFFSNSYKNKKDSLRVLKERGQWLVDIKYIFQHEVDSLPR